MRGKNIYAAAIALAVASALGLTSLTHADPKKQPKVPVLQVDPSFPKPLPNSHDPRTDPLYKDLKSSATGDYMPWVTGEVAGTCVDSQDHVFIVTRGNLISPEGTTAGNPAVITPLTAVPAPPVVEFDSAGNVVNAWGNRATLPNSIHGCFVDYQDNIWIAGNGDGIVQKFTHDGTTMLLQIGTKGVCDNPGVPVSPPAYNSCGNSGANPLANQSHTLLNEPAIVWVDSGPDPVTGQRGSVYIADGYGNHRVAVFNATGTYLRQWGGVAGTVNNPQTDFPDKFASGDGGHPHCVVGGNDGMIYVCDRADDRIQVFSKTGVLQRVINVVPGTGQTKGVGGAAGLGTAGSAWDLRFTNDANQTYFFEIDGGNEIMHTMDRVLGSIVANLGQPGHSAGQFTFLHSNSVDSKGNVYTGETINGRRIQKFVHVQCNNGNGQGNGNGNCS
ncbi:MAG: hypothetical protein ABI580_10265 [Burkholderiaceae bacterium]